MLVGFTLGWVMGWGWGFGWLWWRWWWWWWWGRVRSPLVCGTLGGVWVEGWSPVLVGVVWLVVGGMFISTSLMVAVVVVVVVMHYLRLWLHLGCCCLLPLRFVPGTGIRPLPWSRPRPLWSVTVCGSKLWPRLPWCVPVCGSQLRHQLWCTLGAWPRLQPFLSRSSHLTNFHWLKQHRCLCCHYQVVIR